MSAGKFFGFLFLAAVLAMAWFIYSIRSSGPLTAEKLVYIEPHTSVRMMAAKLEEEGVITSPLAFRIDAHLLGWLIPLKAGEYQFPAGVSVGEAVQLLQGGKTYLHKITIPEGLMAVEIVDLLKAEPALSGDIKSVPEEGTLLPETYKFSRGDKRQAILDRMRKSMQDELALLWSRRSPDIPISTPEEAVTLASIVEKETALPAERPRVAGVFINRLNKHIPLQTDPTVIYALTQGKKKLERGLTLNDLKINSPYNTYLNQGLPPGPIANPGKASLAAVMNPEKNDYLYFVADGSGGHAFSKTLKEHNDNVARWRSIEKSK